jgi:hypothetical protein
MTLTTGYFKVDRGILKYFKRPFTENEAWIWMISQAEYNGDKRGRVKGSMRFLAGTWGRDVATVSRWLKKWSIEENPRISLIYAMSLHNNSATPNATHRATVLKETILLNYNKFQGLLEEDATEDATDPAMFLKKEEKKLKKKSTTTSDEDRVTPNSQVYNFFVEMKRKKHNRLEWLPTTNQAKQLRANIKVVLKSATVEEVVQWLTNFFNDPKAEAGGYKWSWFMSEPLAYSKTGAEPAPSRGLPYKSFN